MVKSPIVTLNGLNTVYTDLLKRIEALGNIYHINGSYDTLNDLINDKKSAEKGEAYNVVNDRLDADLTGEDVEENANYVCYNGYTDGACTIENWTEYWFRINSAFEVANDKSLGLIRIYGANEGDTPSERIDNSVNRKLLLDTEDKAYVNIPVASPYTYGVVDVNAQAFKGEKTFNDSATFEKGATITGKLSTSSVSDATNSLVIAPTDADTEVGDVYVGGTLTVVNDAVFNDVKGKDHSLLLTEANDTLDYDGHPVNSENSPSTSTIGNMNVGGTLTVSNSANVKTVEASNATFNIIEQADIKKFKAIENLSGGVANLKVNNTATVGTVNAGGATFNINNEATIANISATNLKANNTDVNFDNTDNWNKVDVLKVTNNSTSAELNVSTRADISNVATTNLNATTINANKFNGGTGANKGTLDLSYTESADVSNIECTGTLNCSEINVSKVLSTNGTLEFTDTTKNSTVSSIQKLTNRQTEINASNIDVKKIYSSEGELNFINTSSVSQISNSASRPTVLNASTIDVATLTGRENTSDKNLTFTNSATVTTIANKSTELKAKTIDVQALKGSTDNGNTINKDLVFTNSATVSNVTNTSSVSASQIKVNELKGSSNGTNIDKTLTFTNSATVSNITNNTTALTAKVIDVNKLSSNSGTLNVGDGGEVSTPNVSIKGNDGIVTANKFTLTGAGTFSKENTDDVKLDKKLHISSTNGNDATASTIASTNALKVDGGIYAPRIGGVKVYGAVWNDLVDCIEVDDACELEYGRCYAYNNGKFTKTSKYADKSYIGIHSDTSGFEMGDKGDVKQLKSSVAGYVLAYVDAEYPSGTPLTCSKHGVLTKAHFLTRILHPEMVIATYWKNEPKFVWGAEGNEIEVKGRHWVRIK